MSEIAHLFASSKGEYFGISDIGEFELPQQEIGKVMKWFQGQPIKWETGHNPENWREKIRLGNLRIITKGGDTMIINYYSYGKGGLYFSIGADYMWIKTDDVDGGACVDAAVREAYRTTKRGR
jgi:hypothetical protein